MPQPKTKPKAAPQSVAKSVLADALKAATDRATAIKDELDAERAKFREATRPLEEELTELQDVIARIDPLNPMGSRQVETAAPSRRSGGSNVTASQINEDRIIDAVGANQPVTATDIGKAIGVSGNPLSVKLKRMVEDGKLTFEGERRQRVYSLATG